MAGEYILPNRIVFELATDLLVAYPRSGELAGREAGTDIMYVTYASHKSYHFFLILMS